MAEVWKDIPGYEGSYQVSSMGRVKSLPRPVNGVNPYTGKPFIRTVPERILKPGRRKDGHLSVVLGHGRSGSQVHQLVALTFLGPCPDGMEVCHIDGDPSNNRLDNLRYDTRTENIIDVYRQGGRWRKLSAADARSIKECLAKGERGSDLAKRYGVSQNTISNIKAGRTFWWL